MAKNVFGELLISCGNSPVTGFYRNGCCDTGDEDLGVHTVCVVVSAEFLAFSKQNGNDLSTPRPEWNFPGLVPGDKWCLCASRWIQAYHAGIAPKLLLEATHEKTLDYIDLEELVKFAYID